MTAVLEILRILSTIIAVICVLYSSDWGKRLHKIVFKEDLDSYLPAGKQKRYELIISIVAVCVVISTVFPGMFPMVASGVQSLIFHKTSTETSSQEDTKFFAAISCLNTVCKVDPCLAIFVSEYPSSQKISALQKAAEQAAASPRCSRPTPDPKPLPVRAPVDPEKLQTNPVIKPNPQVAMLITWAAKGLNATTKAQLPIAIVKKNVIDADYGIVRTLSEALKSDEFNIVTNPSDAALIIELSIAAPKDSLTGRRMGLYAEHRGSIRLELNAVWIGDKGSLLRKSIDGTGLGSNEQDARGSMIINAVENAEAELKQLAARGGQ